MSQRAFLLALLLSGPIFAEPVTFVTPDGMARVVFPEAVPDHPEGFMITHGDNSYFYKLFPGRRATLPAISNFANGTRFLSPVAPCANWPARSRDWNATPSPKLVIE